VHVSEEKKKKKKGRRKGVAEKNSRKRGIYEERKEDRNDCNAESKGKEIKFVVS